MTTEEMLSCRLAKIGSSRGDRAEHLAANTHLDALHDPARVVFTCCRPGPDVRVWIKYREYRISDGYALLVWEDTGEMELGLRCSSHLGETLDGFSS
jgi:hypothetical protein